MIFPHGRVVNMMWQKPPAWHENKKYAHYPYCIGHFFFIFGDAKKIPDFLLQFLGPNYMLLLLIIIEQNLILKESFRQPKDTSP